MTMPEELEYLVDEQRHRIAALEAAIKRKDEALRAWQALEDAQGGFVLAGNEFALEPLLMAARRLTAAALEGKP